jgi:hypothetical protein
MRGLPLAAGVPALALKRINKQVRAPVRHQPLKEPPGTGRTMALARTWCTREA